MKIEINEIKKIKNKKEKILLLEKVKEEPKEIKLGCFLDPVDDRDFLLKNIIDVPVTTSQIDYTSQMSPVKNQGNLGSCVGFAINAVLEYQQQIEYLNNIKNGSRYRRNKPHYNLSEQWTYWKTKYIDPWGPSIDGTSIRYGLKIVNKRGVPPEHGWPYNENEIGKPAFWAYSVSRWNRNKKYYRINNLHELKEALLTVGPVIGGVLTFLEFFYPDAEGYIKYPQIQNYFYGGHAISIVGFDDLKQRVKFKNSWGKGWGNNGYGYLSYKYLEDFLIDCWATIDLTNISSLW